MTALFTEEPKFEVKYDEHVEVEARDPNYFMPMVRTFTCDGPVDSPKLPAGFSMNCALFDMFGKLLLKNPKCYIPPDFLAPTSAYFVAFTV